MRANALLRCFYAALSVSLMPAYASGPGCDSPVPLGDKPVLRDFADYSEFLVTVMAHKAQEEDQRKHRKLCPDLYRPAPVAEGPTSENLDKAVAASRDTPPFDYDNNDTWYNKSTSRSFGLAGMPSSQMSGETIQTLLMMMDQEPLSEQERGNSLTLQAPVQAIRTGAILAGQQASQEHQQTLIAREQLTQAFGLERWVTGPYSSILKKPPQAFPGSTAAEDRDHYLATFSDKPPTQRTMNGPPAWDSLAIGSDGVLISWHQGTTLVRTQTTIYHSDCWSSCYGK